MGFNPLTVAKDIVTLQITKLRLYGENSNHLSEPGKSAEGVFANVLSKQCKEDREEGEGGHS